VLLRERTHPIDSCKYYSFGEIGCLEFFGDWLRALGSDGLQAMLWSICTVSSQSVTGKNLCFLAIVPFAKWQKEKGMKAFC